MLYLENEEDRSADNNKMPYVHGCVTCKFRYNCEFTNNKILTCDSYWADLTYKPNQI